MVRLTTKQQDSIKESSLPITSKEEKPTLSFASLLNLGKEQESDIKESKEELVPLLVNEDIDIKETHEVLELNPNLKASMSGDALKTLMIGAKSYLKSEIIEKQNLTKQEIKTLPKTLKGLVKVAQKIGIDLSKITIEKIQAKTPKKEKLPLKLSTEKMFLLKKQPKRDKISTQELVAKREHIHKKQQPQTNNTLAKLLHRDTKETPIQKNTQESKPTYKNDVKISREQKQPDTKETPIQKNTQESKPTHKNDVKISREQKQPDTKETPIQKNTQENKPIHKNDVKISREQRQPDTQEAQSSREIALKRVQERELTQDKPKSEPKKIEEVPLFAENLKRTQNASSTTKKSKNSPISLQNILAQDISATTSKTVAPTLKMQRPERFEKLLQENEKESITPEDKRDILSTPKAETLEVKVHEAKQMVKYLSHDVKSAIDEYKSPFTRVKVQLNPEKLGEVDVTIIQRGKNLHINLTSNNSAINTLAMNVNDLKLQLNNSGINNASFHFNNSSGNGDGSFGSQPQQQQQQREHARQEYEYPERQERDEEILSSLEIVVPYYA